MNELILVGSVAGIILTVAAVAVYRTAHGAPKTTVDDGTSADECRDCTLFFGHPAYGPARATSRSALPHPHSGETGGGQ